MNYIIENDYYKVEIASLNAELASIYSKKNEKEFLWQRSISTWKFQARNLFPNIGVIDRERVFIEGKEYPELHHGFAKEMEFECLTKSKNKVALYIETNDYTRKFMPYDFRFIVKFELQDDKLIQTYIVENKGCKDMYFGLGAHTGFYCPINLSENVEDYYLDFEGNKNLIELESAPNTMLTGNEKPLNLENGQLPLTDKTFNNGAILTTNYDNQKVSLCSRKSNAKITVEFEGFPYCTYWSMPNKTYFVCIEPWCGLPDQLNNNHIFEEKKGNNKLAPNAIIKRKQIFTFEV